MTALTRRIQSAIREAATAGRIVEEVGPFVATFTSSVPNPYLNYALPVTDAEPSAADVAALVEAFARRNRTPRLEYVPQLAPAVEPALCAAGFHAEERLALLATSEPVDNFRPDGFELALVDAPADVRAAAEAQWEAYEEEGTPGDEWVAGLQRSLRRGGLLALARAADGDPAGAGQCTVPVRGATELTSVGVRRQFRRRGVARGLTALLACAALDRGCDLVFLMAHSDSEEQRIYRRVGFEPVGEVLAISRLRRT